MLKPRIKKLNKADVLESGDCVVYVMSRDQRISDNHALVAAIKHANSLNLPVVVAFILYPKVKNRLKNQFLWMIEGLKEIEKKLDKKKIAFNIYVGKASVNLQEIEKKLNPACLYFDFSPLRGPTKVKKDFSKATNIACFMVDTHNIVPVWIASVKEEIGARTLRPKINKLLDDFLVEPENDLELNITNYKLKIENNWNKFIKRIEANDVNDYEPIVKPGENEARKVLKDFIDNKLLDYAELRNDPSKDHLSNLSAYLHYGQISSLRIALDIKEYENRAVAQMKSKSRRKRLKESTDSFLEELIIRKELSDNFCYYNKSYDSLDGAKDWAKKTLNKHKDDRREHIYTKEELENAKTHDDAWNAAQNQLRKIGKIHGYMRMYWAKKILEWTNTPEYALEVAIYLNDKYHLDGYDPNGYVGCMWSIAGIHDRGWTERDIFGKIRYMNFNGLKRKFNIEKYIKDWT